MPPSQCGTRLSPLRYPDGMGLKPAVRPGGLVHATRPGFLFCGRRGRHQKIGRKVKMTATISVFICHPEFVPCLRPLLPNAPIPKPSMN